MPLSDIPQNPNPSKSLIFNLKDSDYTSQPSEDFSGKELLLDLKDFIGAKALYFKINRLLIDPARLDKVKVIMGVVNIMAFGGYMAASDVVSLKGKSITQPGEYFYWVGGYSIDTNYSNPRFPYNTTWTNSIFTPAGAEHMDGRVDQNAGQSELSSFAGIDISSKLLISMRNDGSNTLIPFDTGDHTLELNGIW